MTVLSLWRFGEREAVTRIEGYGDVIVFADLQYDIGTFGAPQRFDHERVTDFLSRFGGDVG